LVIEIVDEYGRSLCLLMPSVLCNIGGLGEFDEYFSGLSMYGLEA